MIYILIFIWVNHPFDNAPLASTVAEFNGLAACQAAAKEVRRQDAARTGASVPLILCAAKGEKGSAQ